MWIDLKPKEYDVPSRFGASPRIELSIRHQSFLSALNCSPGWLWAFLAESCNPAQQTLNDDDWNEWPFACLILWRSGWVHEYDTVHRLTIQSGSAHVYVHHHFLTFVLLYERNSSFEMSVVSWVPCPILSPYPRYVLGCVSIASLLDMPQIYIAVCCAA